MKTDEKKAKKLETATTRTSPVKDVTAVLTGNMSAVTDLHFLVIIINIIQGWPI